MLSNARATENLTEKQRAALDVFRNSIRDINREECKSDFYLLRWLKARDFDPKKAEKMLRTHFEWRKLYEVDTIHEWYQCPKAVKDHYPGGFCGHDKEGRPLWVDPIGKADPKGLMRAATFDELLYSRIAMLENLYKKILPERSVEEAKRVHQSTVIFDMEGFGLRHLYKTMVDFQLTYARLSEANYPETMHSAYIINTPSIFSIVFNIFKPVLHEETRKKMHVLRSNYKEELLKHFDAEHLPKKYGGKLCDPDGNPDCKLQICYGGEVPKEMYLKSRDNLLSVSVPRKEFLPVTVNIRERDLGSTVHWEFVTEENDISFSVFRVNSDFKNKKEKKKLLTGALAPEEMIVENHRVNSHLARERGSCVCQKAGTYVLCFDNSYSAVRGKKVRYYFGLQNLESPTQFAECNDDEIAIEETYYEEYKDLE